MTIAEAKAKLIERMPERGRGGLQEAVRKLVRTLGATQDLLYYHTHDSRRSPAGFPDVLILRSEGRMIVAELKRQRANLTREQELWLRRFAKSGAEVYLWRPSHLVDGSIHRVLCGAVGRAADGRVFEEEVERGTARPF